MTHQDLCENLAHAKDTPYINAPLGSMWTRPDRDHIQNILGLDWINKRGGWRAIDTQIADVVRIKPSYTQFCVDVYEVKRTRADFLGDIRKEKWKGYIPHCHRIYFACLKGIVKASEIPAPAGLWLYDPEKKTWGCSKGAELRSLEIPRNTILSFLFWRRKNMGPNDCQRCSLAKHTDHFIRDPYSFWHEYKTKKLKKLGEDLGPALEIVRKKRYLEKRKADREEKRQRKELDKSKKV